MVDLLTKKHLKSLTFLVKPVLLRLIAAAALVLGLGCGVKQAPVALWPEEDAFLEEEGWNPETLFDREQSKKPRSQQTEPAKAAEPARSDR
jgi:hypothetical protein